MAWVELLTVEDTFCVGSERRDTPSILIIHPNLPVPKGNWKERTETVKVIQPQGGEVEAVAQISLSHFNISDPSVSIDQRWRVTILFSNLAKEQVPVGSKILVTEELRDALRPKS